MNQNQIDPNVVHVLQNGQAEVVREQMRWAERQKTSEVRDLCDQIGDRLASLNYTVERVRAAVSGAMDRETFQYAHGAFGSDTDTLDVLLAALGQQVEQLATLRARHEAVERIGSDAGDRLSELFAGQDEQPAEPVALAPGQYL